MEYNFLVFLYVYKKSNVPFNMNFNLCPGKNKMALSFCYNLFSMYSFSGFYYIKYTF
jgi:hypothetical protein